MDLMNPIIESVVMLTLVVLIGQAGLTVLMINHHRAQDRDRQRIADEFKSALESAFRKIEALQLQTAKNIEVLTLQRTQDLQQSIAENTAVTQKTLKNVQAEGAKAADLHESDAEVKDRLKLVEIVGRDTNVRTRDIQENVQAATPVLLKQFDGPGVHESEGQEHG